MGKDHFVCPRGLCLRENISQSKHIVIFDTLIQTTKPEEVEAVLAHELGHWYYNHPMKQMIISQLHTFTVLALFPAFLHAPPLLRSFDFPKEVATQPPTMVAFLLFQMILTPFESVVSIGMNAITRHYEFAADKFAVELQDMVKDEKMSDMGPRLGRALITLHVKNLSTVWVDWLYVLLHFVKLSSFANRRTSVTRHITTRTLL